MITVNAGKRLTAEVVRNMTFTINFPINVLSNEEGIMTINNEEKAAEAITFLKIHGYLDARQEEEATT